MNIHELKTWSLYFEAVKRGEKTFEVRRNDRFFQAGDRIVLLHYDPDAGSFIAKQGYGSKHTSQASSAERMMFVAGPILQGGQFGIEPGYCVFSLLPTDEAM